MSDNSLKRVSVIDSHTGGEPTRVVIDGGPDLGNGPLGERRELFSREFDSFRSAVVNEPRGSDAVVGALLCESYDETCAAGVIFFNNVGCINMCVHGTIGLVVTLAHMQRIAAGEHRIETPVGIVTATLHASGGVTVANVPSYRGQTGVEVEVDAPARAVDLRVAGLGLVGAARGQGEGLEVEQPVPARRHVGVAARASSQA